MLRIVADENVHHQIILNLRQQGLDIISIKEQSPGVTDKEVIKLVEKLNALLVTEDSDFGKWAFVHKKQFGVIFLRYHYKEVRLISQQLSNLLKKYQQKLSKKFTVITVKKVRMRELL